MRRENLTLLPTSEEMPRRPVSKRPPSKRSSSQQSNRHRGTLGHRDIPTKKRQQQAAQEKSHPKSRRSQTQSEATPTPSFWQRLAALSVPVSWLKTLAVLPLAVASLIALVTLLRLLRIQAQVEHIASVISLRFFVLGAGAVLASLLLPLLHRPLRALYVLGHELSHALAVCACAGRVRELHWSSQGGYIIANRSNTFITLAPYLLPFWAMLWTALLFSLNHFWEVPYFERLLWLGLGAAICFHLVFTLWMSTMEQSDFRPNGLAFSLLLIALVNSLWLLAILVWGDPEIQWHNIEIVARDSAKKLWDLATLIIRPSSS